MELYNVGMTFFYRHDNKPCNAMYEQFGCQCDQRCALFDQPGGYDGGACPIPGTQSPSTPSPVWWVVSFRGRTHVLRTASTARR